MERAAARGLVGLVAILGVAWGGACGEDSTSSPSPGAETSGPAPETSEPAGDGAGAPEDTSASAGESSEPAEDTAEPAEDTAEPAEDTAEPAEDTAEPAEDTAEPAEDTAEPAEDTAEPAEDAVEPAADTIEPSDCDVLVASLEAELAKNKACTGPGQCTRYEAPICGSIGCYQRAIHSFEELTDEVWALTQQAIDAQCEDFHCGCDFKGWPACVDQQCVLCPGPSCELTCSELEALILEEVAAQPACTEESHCTGLPSPACDLPGLGCYQVAVHTSMAWGLLPALLQQFGDQGCPQADCDCTDTKVACDEGVCTSQP